MLWIIDFFLGKTYDLREICNQNSPGRSREQYLVQ